jgi:hypothetical protein
MIQLILIINLFNLVYGIHKYNLNIKANNFYVDFDYDKISLKEYDRSNKDIIIKYETISEDNTNKSNKIYFSYFHNELENSIEYVRHIYSFNKTYMEFINEVNHTNKYTNNKINVYLFMKGWQFDNNNNIILNISVNNPVNYDGKYYLEINNFIINFSENCNSDYTHKKVFVERFGNYFYIHFPSYKSSLYYNFSIDYNEYYF